MSLQLGKLHMFVTLDLHSCVSEAKAKKKKMKIPKVILQSGIK